MATPVLLQDDFSQGMKRDSPRDNLPKGAVWNVQDLFPNFSDVPLGKRGGWDFYGSDLSSITVRAGYPVRVAVAPFTAGTQIVAIDGSAFRLFDVTNSVDRGDSGMTSTPIGTPVFYNELLIYTDGANAATKYNGTTIAALGGTPPTTPRCSAVYKDRLLLSGRASVASDHRTIYFSGAGDPESWDTTNRWLRTSAPVQGIAPMPNSVLVFHSGSVERIRGDIPPGSGAANMVIEPLFTDVGLWSPTSFYVSGDKCVWADANGAYSTDGSALTDLTQQGGIRNYWRTQMASVGASGTIAVGVFNGYGWFSLLDNGGTAVVTLLCDLERRTWLTISNARAKNFAALQSATDAFYFSNQSAKQVGNLAGVFTPDGAETADADGWPIIPVVETGYFNLKTKGRKRARNVYVGYSLGGTNEELDVGYGATPDATTYTATSGTFTGSSTYVRRRTRVGKAVNGFSLRLSPGFCEDFAVYSLETETHPQEGSRL
jgi:hypothetical protein